MSEETAEGVKDRLARRFEGSGAHEDRESSEKDTTAEKRTRSSTDHDRNEQRSQNDKRSQNAMKAKNVKKEWKALSVYLPDELESELTRTYKRLDWELEADRGLSIKKTRHYYPLVVELGLERIDEMESGEIEERIESF